MLQLRHILVLVLCCSVFLTAFVVPVSAAELEQFSGVVSLPSNSLGMRDNSLTEDTDYGWSSIPASFTFTEDEEYILEWLSATALNNIYSLVTEGGKTFEYILNFSDGVEPFVDVYFNQFRAYPNFYSRKSGFPAVFNFTGYWELYIDDSLEPYKVSSNYDNVAWPYVTLRETLSVESYIRIVYHSTEQAVKVVDVESTNTISQCLDILCTGLTVNNQPSQLDRIEINIGNIETSIENIEEGVVNIQGTVTDMKEQLEDPDSSIWDAAGEKISSTLEDLFVPTPEDIGAVKDGFDQLSKDKLGGAYTAMETVEDTVRDVTNKLHNPDPNVAIEFPGISVPLGGDIGIVTLAEEQPVTLPTELTAILHPVAGTIFSIICGLGTFNVLKDMVECFLSGYSYAAYLHRNKGGSDG